MAIACVICNDTLEGNPDCELFPFPDKKEQLGQYQQYLLSCGLSESMLPTDGQLYICSKHFASNCFEEDPSGRALKGNAVPTLNLSGWIELGYDDESEDIQMLDEYVPLYNAELGKASTSGIARPMVETLLVPKSEPMDESVSEEIPFAEGEVKTEAPEADESTADPFSNIEPGPSGVSSGKFCILCNNSETLDAECRLYLFPRKIPKIYRKWMLAAGLSIEKYKNQDIYSCQRHFPEKGFFADGKFIQSWATPSLNLPQGTASTSITDPTSDSVTAVVVRSKNPKEKNTEGPKVVIKHNPQNRKNAAALNIDPDEYAKVFTKVVMDLVPKTLKYNGEERPVTGTIVFSSNLF